MKRRLQSWWYRLWHSDTEYLLWLARHEGAARQTTLTSKIRAKRYEAQLAQAQQRSRRNRNPVAEMLRGEWPEDRTP